MRLFIGCLRTQILGLLPAIFNAVFQLRILLGQHVHLGMLGIHDRTALHLVAVEFFNRPPDGFNILFHGENGQFALPDLGHNRISTCNNLFMPLEQFIRLSRMLGNFLR